MELHDFHIHQLHFQLLDWSGMPVNEPFLRDTVNVPYYNGRMLDYPSVRLRMDFRDPNIVGTFVYHCHVLEHEDGGMMGRIRVEPADETAFHHRRRNLQTRENIMTRDKRKLRFLYGCSIGTERPCNGPIHARSGVRAISPPVQVLLTPVPGFVGGWPASGRWLHANADQARHRDHRREPQLRPRVRHLRAQARADGPQPSFRGHHHAGCQQERDSGTELRRRNSSPPPTWVRPIRSC